jgi:hypothetical protein
MQRRTVHLAVLGIFIAGTTIGLRAMADDVAPITKIESRRLPAAEVTRRTLDQLSHILVLDPYPATDVPPKLPLSELWFWTRPRETYVPGLCAIDWVTVNFRPTKPPTQGADTPTLAESIQAKTVYRFVVLPDAIQMENRDWPLGKDNPACAKIDPRIDSTFSAPNEADAAEGVWLLGEVERQAAKGNLSFAAKCDFPRSESSDGCIKDLSELRQDDISDIDRCEPAETDESGCLKIWMLKQSISLKIFSNRDKIVRVSVAVTVTVADPKAD